MRDVIKIKRSTSNLGDRLRALVRAGVLAKPRKVREERNVRRGDDGGGHKKTIRVARYEAGSAIPRPAWRLRSHHGRGY